MKKQAFRPKNPQSGNILFWILLMIFILAALFYALSQSSRTGVSTVTDETARLAASEIVEYGTTIRNAVKAMRISGVPLNQIDFTMATRKTQAGAAMPYDNGNCTTPTCEVYNLNGGGAGERNFYDFAVLPSGYVTSWLHVGETDVILVKVEGIGSSASELVLRVTSVQDKVCEAINKLQGLSWPLEENLTGESLYLFYGSAGTVDSWLAQTDNWHFGQGVPALIGKNVFCIRSLASGGTQVMIVLEGR